jgi:hypothetical protein
MMDCSTPTSRAVHHSLIEFFVAEINGIVPVSTFGQAFALLFFSTNSTDNISGTYGVSTWQQTIGSSDSF